MRFADASRALEESRHGFSDAELALVRHGGLGDLADSLDRSRTAKRKLHAVIGLSLAAAWVVVMGATLIAAGGKNPDAVRPPSSREIASARLEALCLSALRHAEMPGQELVPERVVAACRPVAEAASARFRVDRVADLSRGVAEFEGMLRAAE